VGDLLELMAAPFAACAVLVGIHAYLGMHVIQRKVIFVDLALAQIAALGATFGFLIGVSPHGRGGYFFALGFAVLGAAVFALTRMRNERIPQEAIIGTVYAVALASAILVADRAPEGAEHIKESLVGAILWVTWPTVFKTAVIYAIVGALHIALRRRFLQISFHPEEAYAEGRRVRLWDFIFYITFAFVITSSVAIAGVLLVFAFLVIPAIIATLYATRISARLTIGWAVGIAACLIGLVASYRFDMPSGPAVVSCLGVALVLAGLLHYVVTARRKRSAALRVLAGLAAVAGLVAGVGVFVTSGTFLHIVHEHAWEDSAHPPSEPEHAHRDLGAELGHECHDDDSDCLATRLTGRTDWPELVSGMLFDEDPEVRESAVDILSHVDDRRRLDLLADAATAETDGLLRLKGLRLLAEAGDPRGLSLAVDTLDGDWPALVRDEAFQLLVERSGKRFGYDPFAPSGDNAEAIRKWRVWAGQGVDP
jgi:zinc/manganese transport system permease protein